MYLLIAFGSVGVILFISIFDYLRIPLSTSQYQSQLYRYNLLPPYVLYYISYISAFSYNPYSIYENTTNVYKSIRLVLVFLGDILVSLGDMAYFIINLAISILNNL